MALIECKECGRKISDSAETCPACGLSNTGFTFSGMEHQGDAATMTEPVPQIPTVLYTWMAILGFPIGTGAALGFYYRQKGLLEKKEYLKLSKEIGIGKVVSWIIIVPCALSVLLLLFLVLLIF